LPTRSDEEALVASQKAAEAATAAAQTASTLPAAPRGGLARRNGEGDGGHLSSGLLQVGCGRAELLSTMLEAVDRGLGGACPPLYGCSCTPKTPSERTPSPRCSLALPTDHQGMWNDVLALAVDAPAPTAAAAAAAPSPPRGPAAASPEAASAALRQRALELAEVVLRGGHVAPWTAVAPLVALCTDPSPSTRARALRVLRTHHEKHADFVSDRLAPAGVAEAWRLHRRLWDGAHPGVPPPAAPKAEALQGLGAVYAELVQVGRGPAGGALGARFCERQAAAGSRRRLAPGGGWLQAAAGSRQGGRERRAAAA
jgi:hypothetical protein